MSVQPDGLPLHFFGVTGDKEPQCSLLHFDVVARVDEDAGWRERETHGQPSRSLMYAAVMSPHAHDELIKRNGTHTC